VPDEPPSDTVAQKPDEVGRGAPPSPPAPDADRDQENPSRGAQAPSKKSAEIGEPPSVAERSNTLVSKFVIISVAKARNGGLQTAAPW
jgi:hypothetical protein